MDVVQFKNLNDTNPKKIRLVPRAGAVSDINYPGAITKDGAAILMKLAPASPPITPTDPLALRIVQIPQDFAVSRYFAKGALPAEPDSKTYHDMPQEFPWDIIAFGDPEADPFTIMPSETFVDVVNSVEWPSPYGYIGRDLREVRMTPSHMVIFPSGFVQTVREQVLPTDPTRVVVIVDWVDVNTPDNSFNQPVTAAELIEQLDNGITGFWYSDANNPAKMTLTLDTGLGGEPVVYRVNPILQETPRWESNLLTQNQGYVVPGLFTGLTGYGFVEYGGNNEETNGGGGSSYKAVLANGTGETVGFNGGPNDGMDAFVQPNGDAVMRMKEIGDWYVQFSLLTETDMDLSSRGQGVLNLECHYMKTAVPEHKLFHHRFFYSLRNDYNPV